MFIMSEITFVHQNKESDQLYCGVGFEKKLHTYLMR